MLNSAHRPGSPLASRGPRKLVWVARSGAESAAVAAAAFGVTQRIVLDEILGDPVAVVAAARKAAHRLGLPVDEIPEMGS